MNDTIIISTPTCNSGKDGWQLWYEQLRKEYGKNTAKEIIIVRLNQFLNSAYRDCITKDAKLINFLENELDIKITPEGIMPKIEKTILDIGDIFGGIFSVVKTIITIALIIVVVGIIIYLFSILPKQKT